MTTHEVDVLLHINVTVRVEADSLEAADRAAENLVRAEAIARGFDPEDIADVEAI